MHFSCRCPCCSLHASLIGVLVSAEHTFACLNCMTAPAVDGFSYFHLIVLRCFDVKDDLVVIVTFLGFNTRVLLAKQAWPARWHLALGLQMSYAVDGSSSDLPLILQAHHATSHICVHTFFQLCKGLHLQVTVDVSCWLSPERFVLLVFWLEKVMFLCRYLQ